MKEKTICRGDLFYYDFGTRTGSVQSGTRPVLVIQADDYNRNAPTIIVAAVTGVIKKRYLPSHILLGQEFEMPFLNCFSALRSRPNIALSHWSASLKGETRASLVPVKEEASCAFQPFSVSLYNKEMLAV